MHKLAIVLIKFYQICISAFLGQNCRFHPTCSEYAKQCFERFSFFKALKLSVRRVIKCHPYHPGGVDEVPEDKK